MTAAHGARPGIDLIEIERLEQALQRRPRLAQRLFHEGELSYAQARRRPGRHLAARFAAKEAAIKVLAGAGVAINARDIEVVGSAPPELRLHGRAKQIAEEAGLELQVSLTHSRENAAAVVIGTPSPAEGAPDDAARPAQETVE